MVLMRDFSDLLWHMRRNELAKNPESSFVYSKTRIKMKLHSAHLKSRFHCNYES